MRNVKGVFTMELAMVLVFVASLFVIQVNSTVAVSNRGKLQRVSYSLATILSERKELFNDEGHMCKSEANCKEALRMLYSIAKASMSRMSGEFKPQKLGLQIEELRKTKSHFLHSKRSIGDIRDCNIEPIKNDEKLLPKTSSGRYLPLYQVSVCYETPFNILGAADGEVMHIVSSSISYARF